MIITTQIAKELGYTIVEVVDGVEYAREDVEPEIWGDFAYIPAVKIGAEVDTDNLQDAGTKLMYTWSIGYPKRLIVEWSNIYDTDKAFIFEHDTDSDYIFGPEDM